VRLRVLLGWSYQTNLAAHKTAAPRPKIAAWGCGTIKLWRRLRSASGYVGKLACSRIDDGPIHIIRHDASRKRSRRELTTSSASLRWRGVYQTANSVLLWVGSKTAKIVSNRDLLRRYAARLPMIAPKRRSQG
jgi:hypothetical protein